VSTPPEGCSERAIVTDIDDDEPDRVVRALLVCTLAPLHEGDLHRDPDGIWWQSFREHRDSVAECDALREQLARVKERLENLAAGMLMSAASTSPGRKSEIERGCAEAVRGIAGQIEVTP
jgi:hypothetical protein